MISGTDYMDMDKRQGQTLWQKLAAELVGIYDAHGICAVVAYELAVYSQTTAVVGISDPLGKYYDVWVCESDGRTEQHRWSKEQASFDPIINAGVVIYHEKFTVPPSELVRSELWQLPRDAILAVPIPVRSNYEPVTPPGLICLIDPDTDGPINTDSIAELAIFITPVLDRAYLRQKVDRQEIEFAVVSDISYALTSTLSLQKIYRQLIDPVRRTLNVGSISVGLIDPDTGEIIFVDMLMGALFADLPPLRLKPGQGIAGWVAEHREPVIINDAYKDARFYSGVDRQSGFLTESMACIPLQVEERVIGVMQAINKKNGEFNQNDLRLMQAIGGPLAAAIENARLHAAVLAEKRRIETIFTSMSEGLLTITADGRITHVNEALISLLYHEAIDPDELIGQFAHDIIQLKSGSLDEFIQTVMAAGDEYPQWATDLQPAQGEVVPVLISGAPIEDEEGRVNEMIFVFSDLRQIREVERMRDDFFHGVIHELRTPLATILMYARLLREGKAQDKEKTDRFLGVIERESDRLQKMVRQMLELVKMESSEFRHSLEPVYLNPLFDEMLPPLADRATDKGLTFRQRVQQNLSPVSGAAETYYLIFKNLIDNAIKFTLAGSVRVHVWQEDDSIFVKIQDEGIGIPQQALPNLFGRFFRAQTAVERGIAGTGLGLYMVKEAVEHYNGAITVDSEPGKGATFTVQLPIVKE